MDDNTKKMNAITDVVKSLGVAEKDTQTSGFDVQPRYDNIVKESTPICTPENCPVPVIGKQVLARYRVTQTLSVKMKKETFSKIGQIIQEATAAGANLVGNLQFTLENPNTTQDQARETAIKDARGKAKILADKLGIKLVRITNYSEGGYSPVYQFNYAKSAAADSGGGSVLAPSIQTGENKITSNVNITYEIE